MGLGRAVVGSPTAQSQSCARALVRGTQMTFVSGDADRFGSMLSLVSCAPTRLRLSVCLGVSANFSTWPGFALAPLEAKSRFRHGVWKDRRNYVPSCPVTLVNNDGRDSNASGAFQFVSVSLSYTWTRLGLARCRLGTPSWICTQGSISCYLKPRSWLVRYCLLSNMLEVQGPLSTSEYVPR